MQKTTQLAKQEPVVSWTLLAAALNGVQVSVLSMPTWAHVVIVVVAHMAAALAARTQVVPTADPERP